MAIDLKPIERTDTTALLEVTGVGPSFLNALRRTLMSDVTKLALEEITIYDNTSALFDEMVSHRLGLLPIPTDLQSLNRRYVNNNAKPLVPACTCEGEGCANCTVLFTLSKEGPCTVYSGDLVPAADAKYKIPDPAIPIVKLLEGQRIMLEAGAFLGTGHEHAKWQVVSAVGYQEYPTVKTKGTLAPEAAENVARTAPHTALSVDNGKIVVHDAVSAAWYLKSVLDLYDLHDHVELGVEEGRWLLRVETDGALEPLTALRHASALLMEKLKTVEGEAPKLTVVEQAA